MKRVEQKLSDNRYLVKYNRKDHYLVKLSAPYEGFTIDETINKILSHENQLDHEMDSEKVEKAKYLTRILKDTALAALGIGVFALVFASFGSIIELTGAFNISEGIFMQIFGGILSVGAYEGFIIDHERKKSKNAFRFKRNLKNHQICKRNIESIRKDMTALYKIKSSLGYKETLVQDPAKLRQIVQAQNTSTDTNIQSIDAPKYSFSFSEREETQTISYTQDFEDSKNRSSR